MMTKQQRYISLSQYRGIRKDTLTGSYLVSKSIQGKRYSKTFSSVKEASAWKNSFHPDVEKQDYARSKNQTPSNGTETARTFEDVWSLYETQHLVGLEIATQEKNKVISSIFSSIKETPIGQLGPVFIDKFIEGQKKVAKKNSSKRCNFDHPLKLLRTLFNWYRENYDHTFVNPVLRRHFTIGKIRDVPRREKKLTLEEVTLFLRELDDFWRDFATVHFFIAGRVQEVAGIQVQSVDFKNRSLLIQDVVVWGRNKKFLCLKNIPKNGEIRYCYLTDTLIEIFERRLAHRPKNCSFVFHQNGEPLNYRVIQYTYNKALIACGLGDRFRSTHIMKHSMATITRRLTGSLEATQAVTGHRDQKMVQHYASLPERAQMDAVLKVEEQLKLTEISSCVQMRANGISEEKNQ